MDERVTNIADVSARRVLEVVVEFSHFGPLSPELVAWELSVDPSRVERSWRELAAAGLIEPCGTLGNSDEHGWRLTERGHRGTEERGRQAAG
jgi:Mn-dependent DtxR family transcriptional regulator